MKEIIILFLISSLFLSSISYIETTTLPSTNESLPSSKGGEEDVGGDDPMDPSSPKSAPFVMSDADGSDEVLTPATLLSIPEADVGAGNLPLPPNSYDPFSPSPSPSPDVAKTCQATDNPVLCAEKAGDTLAVLEIEIRATQDATQRALSVSINPKSPDMDALKHCKDVYIDALSNLKAALETVPMKDFGMIKSKLSAAMTNLDTCNQGFSQSNEVSPMETYGGKLKEMVGKCLSIVASIKGEGNVDGIGGQDGQAPAPASASAGADGPVAEVVPGATADGPVTEGSPQGLVAEAPTDAPEVEPPTAD